MDIHVKYVDVIVLIFFRLLVNYVRMYDRVGLTKPSPVFSGEILRNFVNDLSLRPVFVCGP